MQELIFDYRCKCARLLFKGVIFDSLVEVKCKKCGYLNVFGKGVISDSSKQFYLAMNEAGKIVDASFSAEEILGYSRAEILELSIFALLPNTSPERYAQMWQLVARAKFLPVLSETDVKRKDGEILAAWMKLLYREADNQNLVYVFSEVIKHSNTNKGANI